MVDLIVEEEMRLSAEAPRHRRRASREACVGTALRSRNEEGELVPITPRDTQWYINYVSHPQVNNNRFRKKFRRRFRMSYDSYLEHLEDVKECPLFVT